MTNSPPIRGLICTTTFNEVDVISDLVTAVHRSCPELDILVIDDSSPDGTAQLLAALKPIVPRLTVIERPHKLGIGSAHHLGIQYAALNGYDYLITMDADFSHDPGDLPRIREALERNDFVIGSRYAKGGSCDYTGFRNVLSRVGNSLARLLLRIPLNETTTSFRGFSRPLIEHLAAQPKLPEGYSFFFVVTVLACRFSKALAEVPIRFRDRRIGATKISRREIVTAFVHLLRTALHVHAPSRPEDTAARASTPGRGTCPACDAPEHATRIPERRPPGEHGPAVEAFRCSTDGHRSHGRIVECLRCGLVYSLPLPTDHELDRAYSDVVDPVYLANLPARARTFRHNWEPIRTLFPPPARLLDIGSYCGGFLDVALADGYDAQGLEPSAWAAEHCVKQRGFHVRHGTIAGTTYPGAPFDIVTAWDVVEHLRDPQRDLRRINSYLRLGGKFVFSTLNIGSRYTRLLGPRWPWYIDMHLLYFDRRTLAHVLRRAGFHVASDTTYCHIITLEYFFDKLDALGIPGARLLKRLTPRPWLTGLFLPFAFGDITLTICTKVRDVP